MTFAPHLPRKLRLLALAAALAACTAAWADEYGDVNQLLRAGKSTCATSVSRTSACPWTS